MTPRAKLLVGILVLLSAALVWVVASGSREGHAEDGPGEEQVDLAPEWKPLSADLRPAAVDELQSRTGIEIFAAVASFTAPGGRVTGAAPPLSDIQSTALTVANELQRYPASYLKATGLKTVVLAKHVAGGGRKFAGLASPGNHAFLMSIEYAAEVRRQTMHHELFHLFDRTDYDVAAWKALNPPGVDYDPKEARVYVPGGDGIDRTLYAFISRYAMSSPNEDRAELFAFLMVDPRAVLDVAAHDRVLLAKIDRLKLDVRTRIPDMDERFWATR